MATKTKKATKENKTSVAKRINSGLINASIAAINTTVENGEKWQKLASKLIKKSETVRAQQINMFFDTAESVKGQFSSGSDRMKDLVGYDAELVEKAKDMATNNPVSQKVIGIVSDITEKVSENPMVKKAEKASDDIKTMGIAKFNDLKGDVLEQATKIINKGEAIIEDAKTAPKAKATKKTAAKKTVAKKATKTKVKTTDVEAKVVAKKTVAKKTTKATPKKAVTAKKETVAKVAEVEKVVADKVSDTQTKADLKVAEVKTEVKK